MALVTATARHMALTHDAVCAGVAPRVWAPDRTMATLPPNPTRTATSAELNKDILTMEPTFNYQGRM